jgi:hypothetical protein
VPNPQNNGRPKLDHPVNPLTGILFFGVIGIALLFVLTASMSTSRKAEHT